MRTPAVGTGRARPAVELDRPELLQQELRREVVALLVHEADDRREWRRLDLRDRRREVVDAAELHGPVGDDAGGAQGIPKCRRGRERRRAGDVAARACAVDDERRQRRGFLDVEARFPAGDRPPRVEVRLVADDRAGDAPDPVAAHLRRERAQPRRGECRITAAPEHERAAEGGAVEDALAEDVGFDPVRRAERLERGEGERELLVRCRRQGPRGVLRVEQLT
jgi:hypothetical protein